MTWGSGGVNLDEVPPRLTIGRAATRPRRSPDHRPRLSDGLGAPHSPPEHRQPARRLPRVRQPPRRAPQSRRTRAQRSAPRRPSSGRTGGLHLLRHTHGSLLANAGQGGDQIAARLGHRDAGFTARTYVHADRNRLADAPAAIDALRERERARALRIQRRATLAPDEAGRREPLVAKARCSRSMFGAGGAGRLVAGWVKLARYSTTARSGMRTAVPRRSCTKARRPSRIRARTVRGDTASRSAASCTVSRTTRVMSPQQVGVPSPPRPRFPSGVSVRGTGGTGGSIAPITRISRRGGERAERPSEGVGDLLWPARSRGSASSGRRSSGRCSRGGRSRSPPPPPRGDRAPPPRSSGARDRALRPRGPSRAPG